MVLLCQMNKEYHFSKVGLWQHMILFAIAWASQPILAASSGSRNFERPELWLWIIGIGAVCFQVIRICFSLFKNRTPEVEILQDRLVMRRFWYLGMSTDEVPFEEIGHVEISPFGSILVLKSHQGREFSCNKHAFLGRLSPSSYTISPNGMDYWFWKQGVGGVWRPEMVEIGKFLSKLPGVKAKGAFI
jgi:hypothetical protein